MNFGVIIKIKVAICRCKSPTKRNLKKKYFLATSSQQIAYISSEQTCHEKPTKNLSIRMDFKFKISPLMDKTNTQHGWCNPG